MTSSSPFQRFMAELRRRHVPQTVAVYVVAAWAAIQFADVVVPNLGWPQGVVTAVIVAAGVGLPVVVVLAWLLEWGPEGIHRAGSEPGAESESEPAGRPVTGGPPPSRHPAPWPTAVGVLVVGVGIAIAVAGMLDRADGSGDADPEASLPADPATRFERRRAEHQIPQAPPRFGLAAPGYADSLVRAINDSIARELDEGGDLDALVEMATRLGENVGPAPTEDVVDILEPRTWSFGAPHPVPARDTLRIRGVARAEGGVAAVELDGRVVASSDAAPPVLAFEAIWVAGNRLGATPVRITVRGAEGSQAERRFAVRVVPATTDR